MQPESKPDYEYTTHLPFRMMACIMSEELFADLRLADFVIFPFFRFFCFRFSAKPKYRF